MIINFNNRQQTFSSCLWTLSFKNDTAIDIQAHQRHADQATQFSHLYHVEVLFTFYLEHLNLVSYT